MRLWKYIWFSCLLSFMIWILGGTCLASGLSIYVSILPQKFVVDRIGGELVDVSVMVRAGASPATYDPTPRQMAALARARAYFAIGVPFEEAWLERFAGANPDLVMAHVDEGIEKMAMEAHEHHEEGHEEEHHEEHGEKHHDEHDEGHHDKAVAEHDDHHHDGLDPHIWLAPELMHIIAANTEQALSALDPDNSEIYKNNLRVFLNEIEALDSDIRKTLDPVPAETRTFMVFHPSWGYFARQYGLTQLPIEAEGKEPGPRALAGLIAEGREMGVKVVFVQPQFSDKSAQVIASELGAQVIRLDPLAEDWADNLRKAAGTFAKVLH